MNIVSKKLHALEKNVLPEVPEEGTTKITWENGDVEISETDLALQALSEHKKDIGSYRLVDSDLADKYHFRVEVNDDGSTSWFDTVILLDEKRLRNLVSAMFLNLALSKIRERETPSTNFLRFYELFSSRFFGAAFDKIIYTPCFKPEPQTGVFLSRKNKKGKKNEHTKKNKSCYLNASNTLFRCFNALCYSNH